MPHQLSPSQVKAARSLLAWSQQDLAAAARVATSTVADFERGQRTPVANNALAIREALEARGVTFLAGGAVIGDELAPVVAPPTAGVPLRWIRATDISQWGERRDGQAGLPELVAKLILAAKGPRAQVRFPSDESVAHPGWDGLCNAVDGEVPYIPAGISAWELGAGRGDIRAKAQRDYEKRSQNSLGIEKLETTYVFVTTQRWSAKDEWASSCRSSGQWRDVRVLDANDLVHWLERYPAVALWLAVRINRRPKGVRELTEAWNEWSRATTIPLSTDLTLIDRDREAKAIHLWLKSAPQVLAVQAESIEESVAFFYSALSILPDDHLKSELSRCVVVESDADARELMGIGAKLRIVVSAGSPGLGSTLVADGHHVYVACSSEWLSGNPVVLTRPWRHSIEVCLEQMNVPAEEAHRLAKTSGRSLTILRRSMESAPGKISSWAIPPPSLGILTAMLAGAWRDDLDSDRHVLERLSAASYGDVVESLTALSPNALSSPIRRTENIWRLASLKDVWAQIVPCLSNNHVDRLIDSFLDVLGAESPEFDVGPSDRWRLKRNAPSNELRRGLAEAMIALSMFSDRAQAAPDAARRVDQAVHALLHTANDRVWWSLAHDFRRLAEASPNEFLTAIDDALDDPRKPLASLFRSEPGVFGSSEYLSDLLWALEILAWSPEYLSTVTLVLARLVEIDPGGRSENRPANSLRQILLPWHPQTYATAAQRMQTIEALLEAHPLVGWMTLLSLAPQDHDISHDSPPPDWRDFTGYEQEVTTWTSVATANAAIGKLLLDTVGRDVAKWQALLTRWSDFDEAWRSRASRQLSAVVSALSADERSNSLRESLRKLIQRHESFSEASWAMNEADLEALRPILKMLEPARAIDRHLWLFKDAIDFAAGTAESWAERQRQLESLRARAAREIIDESEGRLSDKIISIIGDDYFFGSAVIECAVSEETKEALLAHALDTETTPLLVRGMLRAYAALRGDSWLEERFRSAHSDTARLHIALAMRPSSATFELVKRSSAALERAYWSNVFLPSLMACTEVAAICEALIAADRARAAVTFVGQTLAKHSPPTSLLLHVLEAALTDDTAARQESSNDSAMFSYGAGLIFQRLDAVENVLDAGRLVALEWAYYQVLAHSQRPPRALHRALAEYPKLFVQLLQTIFPRSDGESTESLREAEQPRAVQAATHAYRVLSSWSTVPGSNDDGLIDADALARWVKEARQLSLEAGLAGVADEKIGEILSAAIVNDDDAWPPRAVRDLIEKLRNRDLERGFLIGTLNRRGVTTRLPLDGGAQERELVHRYRGYAKVVAFKWPRTRAILDNIAESYLAQARREDATADLFDS